jgi:hypothetical protein
MTPHPGCEPFYQNNDETLKGYKVYRNSCNTKSPWLITPPEPKDKFNKTVDLIPKDILGNLTISFKGLNDKELSLLLEVCRVDWKIGGGKPLGLGHVRVQEVEWLDEFADIKWRSSIDAQGYKSKSDLNNTINYEDNLKQYQPRIKLYVESQKPKNEIAYPNLDGLFKKISGFNRRAMKSQDLNEEYHN